MIKNCSDNNLLQNERFSEVFDVHGPPLKPTKGICRGFSFISLHCVLRQWDS